MKTLEYTTAATYDLAAFVHHHDLGVISVTLASVAVAWLASNLFS